jgi:hypothetical protein
MTENWVPVPGTNLSVSDLGRVRGVRRAILRQQISSGGYPQITHRTGQKRHFKVHRLILLAFVGACPPGMQCRHLNGDKTDNRLANLCWGTRAQNMADKVGHGTSNRGERGGGSKLKEHQVREIRSAGAVSNTVLARRYGVTSQQIGQIRLGKSWWYLDEG